MSDKQIVCAALCRNHLSGFAEPCAEACITGAGVAFDCEHSGEVWGSDAQHVLDALKEGVDAARDGTNPSEDLHLHLSSERRRGLEEAAKVADEFDNAHNDGHPGVAGAIARSIRALIPPSSEGGSGAVAPPFAPAQAAASASDVIVPRKTLSKIIAQAAFIRLRGGKENVELWNDAGRIMDTVRAVMEQEGVDAALGEPKASEPPSEGGEEKTDG